MPKAEATDSESASPCEVSWSPGRPQGRPGGSPEQQAQPRSLESLVCELWHHPEFCSRNRNFDLFSDDVGRRALRVYRNLRFLRRQILRQRTATVIRDGESSLVVVEVKEIHARRRVTLSAALFGLLVEDTELRPYLA